MAPTPTPLVDAPVSVEHSEAPHHSHLSPLTTACIVLTLFAALLTLSFFVFFFAPTAALVSGVFVLAELRTAVFIGTEGNGVTAYAFKGSHLVPTGFTASSMPLSLVRTGDAIIATLLDGHTYVLSRGAHTLESTSTPLLATSVSPNGAAIALTQAPSIPSTGGPAAITVAQSAVSIFYPATKRTLTVSKGAGAFFLDDTRLLYSTQNGVFSTNLATRQTNPVLIHVTNAVTTPFIMSPDRTLVAWSAEGKIQVYRSITTATTTLPVVRLSATSTVPRSLPPGTISSSTTFVTVGTFPVYGTYALTDTFLYQLHTSRFGTLIYRYPLTSPVRAPRLVGILPRALHIIDLLP